MNLLKERLNSNQFILGTMISEISSPNLPRMLKAGGFEFAILDCEHGSFDYSDASGIIGIANCINMPIVVRIPEIRREVITKYMDMGANGLMSPMTGCRKDIEALVQYAKYYPLGKRGISTQRAHTSYNPPKLSSYMEMANNETIVIAQLETKEGINNASDILSVEGVDCALVGPNDLACDLGAPGNFDTEEMKVCLNTVVAASKEQNKPCGIISGNIPFLKSCRDMGMTVFSCNSEIGIIISGSKKITKEF
jgi:2-dehydro-3-deoxyglucarate aldolase/4-hydroxy-2-oxoheptanedioate aldolase